MASTSTLLTVAARQHVDGQPAAAEAFPPAEHPDLTAQANEAAEQDAAAAEAALAQRISERGLSKKEQKAQDKAAKKQRKEEEKAAKKLRKEEEKAAKKAAKNGTAVPAAADGSAMAGQEPFAAAAPGAPAAANDPDFEAMNLRAEARRKAKAAEAAMFGEPDGQPTPVVSASAVSDAHQPPLCSQHVSHACAAWPVQQARRAA